MTPQPPPSLVVLGGGTFGTSLAAALARTGRPVTLVVRDPQVVASIQTRRVNEKYLPDARLPKGIHATAEIAVAASAQAVFLAVPSHSLLATAGLLQPLLRPGTVVLNLAKGLHEHHITLDRALQQVLPHCAVGALKGPNFARPLLHGAPTGMTLALPPGVAPGRGQAWFQGSNVQVEEHADVSGIEFVAAVKNVIAIAMGLCDAIEDNPNTRFMVVSKLIAEAHRLVGHFGYDPSVMFTFAGLGDMLMTSLNDASRNRTLGLLIGRGFDFVGQTGGPVMEGRKATRLLAAHTQTEADRFPIVHHLDQVFSAGLSPQAFYQRVTKPAL
ncbi:NAD(P)H-dependent glycerol-3-phosphate dehydrogenase [Ideonella livida]|uniref:Glycerol-3-phosphate dehydrogenase n=1 Tax=Ideonella livida TaxID=2707176 RepID=A0A7C9TJZ9_9BURK|nr:NAD(P)H-dependent glycerol-3-phosphate dehydrogenase [Ideonella livida]NDY90965.1 NAD(P)-binding domain-containing protein [Ideonella livida]